MSQALTLARPYARAAYAAASDEKRAPEWSQALQYSAQIAADPQANAVLNHPQLSAAEAVTLLAPQSAGEGYLRFLGVLAGNRRLTLLPEITGLYEQLRADAERIVKAKVITAAPIEDSELEKIRAGLKRRFDREVEIETVIDESLIGGAIIDAGEVVIDGSLRGKLNSLQNAIAS